ncbi:MAG: hypothetical protein NTU89_01280 [Candidatus Dependentiae bacterium]|nr:hypothetical protein [Candidatus Dependentiae bacterium]
MENLKQLRPLVEIKKVILRDEKLAKNFNPPFCDFQIIELQNIFMTPRIHKITVKNITSGRSLINTFLNSLNYYHNVGCLTAIPICLDLQTVDMYQLIQEYTQSFEIDRAIEDFFVEHSYFDFVWIEMTKDLLDQFSLQDIKRMCEILTVNESIPVIMIHYEN